MNTIGSLHPRGSMRHVGPMRRRGPGHWMAEAAEALLGRDGLAAVAMIVILAFLLLI